MVRFSLWVVTESNTSELVARLVRMGLVVSALNTMKPADNILALCVTTDLTCDAHKMFEQIKAHAEDVGVNYDAIILSAYEGLTSIYCGFGGHTRHAQAQPPNLMYEKTK